MEKNIFLVFLFSTVLSFSQNTIDLFAIDSIPFKADKYIGKDNLRNDYFTFKNALLKKNNEREFEYQNLSLGKIEQISITNPLQIVIFYEDFNSLVLLDNQLNETQKIEGNTFETPFKIEAFGLASQNQVWLYDGFLQKISIYNFKSNVLKTISTPLTTKIKSYSSDYNYFYWISDTLDFYSISIFGKIKKISKVPPYDAIQIIDSSKIIYLKDNEIYYFNTINTLAQKINLNQKSLDNFFFSNGILSIFTHNQIINYKIDLP